MASSDDAPDDITSFNLRLPKRAVGSGGRRRETICGIHRQRAPSADRSNLLVSDLPMTSSPDLEPGPTRPPHLVFDSDCRFCRLWIERWHDLTGTPSVLARRPRLRVIPGSIPAPRQGGHLVQTAG
jgi:hypothetical protein